MVNYTTSLIWLAAWPLIIYVGYKFAAFNMAHFTRLEALWNDEKKCPENRLES